MIGGAFDVLVRTGSNPSGPSNETQLDSMGPPSRTTGLKKRRAYRKEELPLIKYWTRKDYDRSRNNASTMVIQTMTADSSLPFMELEDGTPISDAVAVQMRLMARGIFAHLLSEKSAPAKWGQVSIVSQDFFFKHDG